MSLQSWTFRTLFLPRWQPEAAWFADSASEGFSASRASFWTRLEPRPLRLPLQVLRCRSSVSCGWLGLCAADTLVALDLTCDLHAPKSSAAELQDLFFHHTMRDEAVGALFPRLRDLRVGQRQTHQAGGATARVPVSTIARLCPRLASFDASYVSFAGGVDFDEAKIFARRLGATLVALDLSMCMTWVDFDPVLADLGASATQLRALAVHGLRLSDAGLTVLGDGCRKLRRLHLVGCRGFDPDTALWPLVRRERGLAELDLSHATLATPLAITKLLTRTENTDLRRLVLAHLVFARDVAGVSATAMIVLASLSDPRVDAHGLTARRLFADAPLLMRPAGGEDASFG
jgi:hypothetical protein